jgi:hypothetical protein
MIHKNEARETNDETRNIASRKETVESAIGIMRYMREEKDITVRVMMTVEIMVDDPEAPSLKLSLLNFVATFLDD